MTPLCRFTRVVVMPKRGDKSPHSWRAPCAILGLSRSNGAAVQGACCVPREPAWNAGLAHIFKTSYSLVPARPSQGCVIRTGACFLSGAVTLGEADSFLSAPADATWAWPYLGLLT